MAMKKRLKKCDLIFIVGMLATLIMHLVCIYGADHFADESLYPTVPLRLLNGDSLVIDEWHVTQFVSLFLYFPVKCYIAIKGSTQGIILFLRYFYLMIHTGVSIGLYKLFRKYTVWAVIATLMFYTQVPLRFMSANYHSLLALFLLFFTITLLKIYENDKIYLYVIAGFCYGCCCVCNPFECFVFAIYIIACLIWSIKHILYKKKMNTLSDCDAVRLAIKCKYLKRFFGIRAFFGITLGLSIAATISIVFFFSTGGTIAGLLENIPNLLSEGSHDMFSEPLFAIANKISTSLNHFSKISLGFPFILPIFYLVLFFDRKRRKFNHKIVYICIAFVVSVFYIVGITIGSLNSSRQFAITLPFFIIASVCYILTENKNKKLFYCMWLPSVIATVIQHMASDMHLSVFWVLIIANIAGVFFVKDFIDELVPLDKNKSNSLIKMCSSMICIVIGLQLVFQCSLYMIGRVVKSEYAELERGPYAGLRLEEQNLQRNNSIMDDLDIIKERTEPDDPVLIISEFSWMYLYVERPFATYSAWQPILEIDRLNTYFSLNPEKIPKYIYVPWVYIPSSVLSGHGLSPERAQKNVDVITENFNCDIEELSNGFLLTVK